MSMIPSCMPLHVYEGQSGKLVTTILKPGKRSDGNQMLAIMTRLITHLRTAWSNTMILVRGDNHFASPEVMEWIETQPHVVYLTHLVAKVTTRTKIYKEHPGFPLLSVCFVT